jgi:putative transposase
LQRLGYTISDQTIRNILKRHGIPPAPERKKTTTWQECIRTHMDGLVTCYILFFIHLASRKVHMAGMTPHPDQRWMAQIQGERIWHNTIFP